MCCDSVGGTRNRLPAKRRIGSTSVAGTTAQPSRQPVMHQYFENVFTTTASGRVLEHRFARARRK